MITDEALMAFAQWCRLNPGWVSSTETVRRVFDAYARIGMVGPVK